MPDYRVTWTIDLWAENMVNAAQKARSFQTDPDTTAVVFEVEDEDGNKKLIDLQEED